MEETGDRVSGGDDVPVASLSRWGKIRKGRDGFFQE